MLRKVTIETGTVEGLPGADPRITVFKGIPFAAPPVGDLRWCAPQPAKNWDGVFKAYTFGPIAMQIYHGVSHPDSLYTKEWHVDLDTPISEDCLQLNVWTPAKKTDEKLPVMIWIYGGANLEGYPYEMVIDGEPIARRGVILVSINYRINAFGFLAHPELTRQDPQKATNFGHWDQKAGIEWVKRNIAAFGGDPGNITVFGESSGGGSTVVQFTSPLNKGLFQRAILHSGGGLLPPSLDMPKLSEAEKKGETFFEFLGVRSLEEARALDAEIILKKGLEFTSTYFWGSVIDGSLITDHFSYIIKDNKYENIDIINGNTVDEYSVKPGASTLEELESYARAKFGSEAETYLQICKQGAGDIEQMNKNGSYNRFEIANLLWGDVNAQLNASRMYYFNFNPEIPGPDHPGSFHASDLWFAFETLAKSWRPFVGKHYDLARQMCNYWTNFAKTGDPNGNDSDGTPMPEWTEYSAQNPYPMYFGEKASIDKTPRSDLKKFLLDFYMNKLKNRDLSNIERLKRSTE